jgi:hypothetical protein
MKKFCLICKSDFNVPKCRYNSAKYCSLNCRKISQKTNLNPQRKRVSLNCLHCNVRFTKLVRQIKYIVLKNVIGVIEMITQKLSFNLTKQIIGLIKNVIIVVLIIKFTNTEEILNFVQYSVMTI